MRKSVVVALGCLSLGSLGSNCTPLFDLNAPDRAVTEGRQLAAAIIAPNEDRAVSQGTIVGVEWSGANLTGEDAIATVLVRNRADRAETVLVGGVRITSTGVHESIDWDTTGYDAGRYNIIVRIDAGALSDEDVSDGVISINGAPLFEFTEPTTDVTLADQDPNDTDREQTLTIRWSASDPDNDGSLVLSIDSDSDHETGNETQILVRDIPGGGGFDSFIWNGEDTGGDRVAEGTYFLFATVSDDTNAERFVTATGRVIVPAAPEDPPELAITKPEEDAEFRADTSGATFAIEFTLPGTQESLVDLKVDSDDNHQNGNEITIVSQRLEAEEQTNDSVAWNGQNSSAVDVPDGVYRVFLVQTRETGTPTTVQSEGLCFLRREADKPLIGVTEPNSDQTLRSGQFLTIRWRDDVKESTTPSIALFIDDDANPEEGAETGDAELEVLTGRDGKADGVQDTFAYQIPSTLAPGIYYIFAYIDRDGARPFESRSVAGGRLIIDDPNQP